jgi:glycosyltransferase involved in cell wall biosynthesis
MAHLRDQGVGARLCIVGEGEERADLEARVKRHGLGDRVEFLGTLTHDGLLPLYRRAWMLVAPSRVLANGRRDGIPNVVVEALAMGLPCAGTRAAGLEEAIEPGVTGTLVEPDDANALAEAIATLLKQPERLGEMGSCGRDRVAEAFDAERNFERLFALMANGARA